MVLPTPNTTPSSASALLSKFADFKTEAVIVVAVQAKLMQIHLPVSNHHAYRSKGNINLKTVLKVCILFTV